MEILSKASTVYYKNDFHNSVAIITRRRRARFQRVQRSRKHVSSEASSSEREEDSNKKTFPVRALLGAVNKNVVALLAVLR